MQRGQRYPRRAFGSTAIRHEPAIRRQPRRSSMNNRTILAAAVTALVLITATGCSVQRGQQTTGAYIDDSAITAKVKSEFVESKAVDASSITVETLNGTVMLSGFAKSEKEKDTARMCRSCSSAGPAVETWLFPPATRPGQSASLIGGSPVMCMVSPSIRTCSSLLTS
jgi:hyperosmotically inducible periplasmic protein